MSVSGTHPQGTMGPTFTIDQLSDIAVEMITQKKAPPKGGAFYLPTKLT
jgi:hypothetical protein